MLADFRTAPIAEPLRATLAVLEAVTLAPERVPAEEVRAALAAGATGELLRDAIAVCAVFNVIDRVADALAFDVPAYESFEARAERMLAARYRLPTG